MITSDEFAKEMEEKEIEKRENLAKKEREKQEKLAKREDEKRKKLAQKEKGKGEKLAQKGLKKKTETKGKKGKEDRGPQKKKRIRRAVTDDENSLSEGDEGGEENPKPRKIVKRSVQKNMEKNKTDKKKCDEKKDLESEESSADDPTETNMVRNAGSDTENNEDNERCGTCKKSFQKDFHGEQWIRCVKCQVWHHQICQSVRKYVPNFVCDSCPLSAIVDAS